MLKLYCPYCNKEEEISDLDINSFVSPSNTTMGVDITIEINCPNCKNEIKWYADYISTNDFNS